MIDGMDGEKIQHRESLGVLHRWMVLCVGCKSVFLPREIGKEMVG